MAKTWQSIKDAEKFNKGRAAVRGDYLSGTYNKSKFADFHMPIKQGGRLWRRQQREAAARAEENATAIWVAIEKLDAKRAERKEAKG